jgi:hypothetical protein
MEKAQSFEVTEYGKDQPGYDCYAVIKQIVEDREREAPNIGIRVSFHGDQLRLHYHTYEMLVPTNMREIEVRANDVLNDCLKYLKKEYKVRTKKALSLKELKDMANYTVQKVSLNERYYVVFWRCYELG